MLDTFWDNYLNEHIAKIVVTPFKWTRNWAYFNVPNDWIGL